MQLHCADITYIPMARGFVYLAVVLDWATRRVLSWRLSITMEAAFCVETFEDAFARHGRPDIFNTDQGSQFTGSAFTGVLASNAIAISMDGKGAWRDNIFIGRLSRSVKYEEVYLRAYETVSERATRSVVISTSTIDAARIRVLTEVLRIKPASPCCRSAWLPNPAEAPLIDAESLFRQSEPAQPAPSQDPATRTAERRNGCAFVAIGSLFAGARGVAGRKCRSLTRQSNLNRHIKFQFCWGSTRQLRRRSL
jgi:transposase InsO family protein